MSHSKSTDTFRWPDDDLPPGAGHLRRLQRLPREVVVSFSQPNRLTQRVDFRRGRVQASYALLAAAVFLAYLDALVLCLALPRPSLSAGWIYFSLPFAFSAVVALSFTRERLGPERTRYGGHGQERNWIKGIRCLLRITLFALVATLGTLLLRAAHRDFVSSHGATSPMALPAALAFAVFVASAFYCTRPLREPLRDPEVRANAQEDPEVRANAQEKQAKWEYEITDSSGKRVERQTDNLPPRPPARWSRWAWPLVVAWIVLAVATVWYLFQPTWNANGVNVWWAVVAVPCFVATGIVIVGLRIWFIGQETAWLRRRWLYVANGIPFILAPELAIEARIASGNGPWTKLNRAAWGKLSGRNVALHLVEPDGPPSPLGAEPPRRSLASVQLIGLSSSPGNADCFLTDAEVVCLLKAVSAATGFDCLSKEHRDQYERTAFVPPAAEAVITRGLLGAERRQSFEGKNLWDHWVFVEQLGAALSFLNNWTAMRAGRILIPMYAAENPFAPPGTMMVADEYLNLIGSADHRAVMVVSCNPVVPARAATESNSSDEPTRERSIGFARKKQKKKQQPEGSERVRGWWMRCSRQEPDDTTSEQRVGLLAAPSKIRFANILSTAVATPVETSAAASGGVPKHLHDPYLPACSIDAMTWAVLNMPKPKVGGEAPRGGVVYIRRRLFVAFMREFLSLGLPSLVGLLGVLVAWIGFLDGVARRSHVGHCVWSVALAELTVAAVGCVIWLVIRRMRVEGGNSER